MIFTSPARKLTHLLQDVYEGRLRRWAQDFADAVDEDPRLGNALAHLPYFVRDLDRLYPDLFDAESASHVCVRARVIALALSDDDLGHVCVLDLARELVDELARDLTCARSRARDFVRARSLARAHARALALAEALAITMAGEDAPEWGTTQGKAPVAWSAGQLVAIATRLLPGSDRARYAEEFGGELWDLAEAKVRRWRQIAYAVRLLARAGHLRLELKAPHRRKASSP